jgi:CCR4-NOT transcription complex subunit 2
MAVQEHLLMNYRFCLFQEASEFNISSEDFPALPGTAQRNRRASSDDKPPTGGLGTAVPSQPPGLGLSDPSRSSRAPGAERQAAQERGIQTHPDGRVSNIPASMLKDQFGITGLLSFIRVAENQSDLVSLSLGQDLKTLGNELLILLATNAQLGMLQA